MRSLVLEHLARLWGELMDILQGIFFHDHPTDAFEASTRMHEVKLAFCFMLFFWFARQYLFGKLMVERLGEYLGVMVSSIALKLVNQCISLGMHLYSTLWGVFYLSREPWFHEVLGGSSDVLWRDLRGDNGAPMSAAFKVFYMVHLGYQMHALHFTVHEGRSFSADRRADYRQMLVHHVIAVLLIFLSYVLGYARIGVLVMISHNVSDIAVCLTKSAKLLGWRRATLYLLPVMIFTWFVTRLVFFPFYVLYQVYLIPLADLPHRHLVPITSCFAGLLVLLGLNIFWFVIFLRMAWASVMEGTSIDVTESMTTNSIADKYGMWNKRRWWEVGG